jgi:hypothetical protein
MERSPNFASATPSFRDAPHRFRITINSKSTNEAPIAIREFRHNFVAEISVKLTIHPSCIATKDPYSVLKR